MARERQILGPPGTGKTTYIKHLVEGWVDAGEYEAQDIVLTSFTRSAAAVLAGAVAVPRENIATLHALAFRALGSPPIAEKGKLAAQWDEQHATSPSWQVGSGAVDINDGLTGPDSKVGEMLRRYSLARARMVDAAHPLFVSSAPFAVAWEDFKTETESMDFTDLLDQAYQKWDGLPGMQPVLMVDEAQDMTPLQWRLAREWGGSADCELFMVAGDPAQAVYGFAGSDPAQFLIDLLPAQRELLPRSYRMPPEVQVHAERFLQRHSGSLSKERNYTPRQAVGRVRQMLGATWRTPGSLIRHIEEAVTEGRSVMILATCAYMLQPILTRLRQDGLPFHNPYRRSNGAWNPLGAAHRSASDGEGQTSTVERLLSFLGGSVRLWPEMVRYQEFVMRGAKKRLEEEATPDVLREWGKAELIFAWEGRDLDWLGGHVLPQYQKPLDYAATIIKRRGRGSLLDIPQIIPSTIHAAKGGEADVVIIFPDVSQAGYLELYGSTEGRDAAIRLGYVALTRAREELWLCQPVAAKASMW